MIEPIANAAAGQSWNCDTALAMPWLISSPGQFVLQPSLKGTAKLPLLSIHPSPIPTLPHDGARGDLLEQAEQTDSCAASQDYWGSLPTGVFAQS